MTAKVLGPFGWHEHPPVYVTLQSCRDSHPCRIRQRLAASCIQEQASMIRAAKWRARARCGRDRLRGPGPQSVTVVDRVTAGEHRVDRHRLVAHVGPPVAASPKSTWISNSSRTLKCWARWPAGSARPRPPGVHRRSSQGRDPSWAMIASRTCSRRCGRAVRQSVA